MDDSMLPQLKLILYEKVKNGFATALWMGNDKMNMKI